MYILRPEIDITFLRDAVSESRIGHLEAVGPPELCIPLPQIQSRGLQVLHIVSTNSGTRDRGDPRRTVSLARKEYPKVR